MTVRPTGQRLPLDARRAIRGGFLGFFVDMFDVYLPVVVLTPALIYFIPPGLDPTSTAVVSASIFAATLVGRPLGAMIFGHYADRIGRRRATIVALYGFGTATLIMALLPGYATLGSGVIVIFVALRFVNGIFLGGQYTAASPLAMEYTPKQRRGFYGAVIQSGYPIAFFTISLITYLLLSAFPAGGLESAYVQWVWRIPFLLATALALGLAAYYQGYVDESAAFRTSRGATAPLKTLLRGDTRRDFLQVFVLMSGFWLSVQPTAAVLPGLLQDPIGLTSAQATLTLVITYIAVTALVIGGGALSQHTGRRPFLLATGAIIALAAPVAYYLTVSLALGFTGTLLLTVATTLLGFSCWGVATTYITERFRTGVRATGFGLGYSLAIVIPSFYAYFQIVLAELMPFAYTGIPLLVLGGALIVLGAAMGPETRDVDFSPDRAQGPT